MNPLPITPPSRSLRQAPPLEVQRNKAPRGLVQTPPSPSPAPALALPQPTPGHWPQHMPMQTSPLAAPSPMAQTQPQPPKMVQDMPFQRVEPRPPLRSSEEAQRAYAPPVPQLPAPSVPWLPMPYHLHNAQMQPPTPYDAIPPPAQFVHALPTFMEPHTVGPVYTTPNGMLEYYAHTGACGRTRITMMSWASSMQGLYQELGCSLPRYQEPDMQEPNAQG